MVDILKIAESESDVISWADCIKAASLIPVDFHIAD
jgi:hypothetical protein